jgi:hypothetical protein
MAGAFLPQNLLFEKEGRKMIGTIEHNGLKIPLNNFEPLKNKSK